MRETAAAVAAAEMRALLQRQESLRAVVESISSELELRPLLTRIVRHACELIGADNGTIGLYDPERNVIRTEAVFQMPPDELGAEMGPDVGLAGHVLRTQMPLVLDRYGDVRAPTLPRLSENSVVGIPIFWRGRMIGFFGIGASPRVNDRGEKMPPKRFTETDVETLTLFARHAAVAIENARLFDTTQRALADTQLLYDTSARMNAAGDTGEVIAAYLRQVAAGAERHACTVALYENDAQGRRTHVCVVGAWHPDRGLDLSTHRHPYTFDALDAMLDAGETVTIRDVHSDPRVSSELRRIQEASGRPALCFIPLRARGQRIGLVILSSGQVRDWPEHEVRPYQITAAQLATAIESREQQRLLYQRGQEVAVLEERQRLARDLHDSVTQHLFAMTLIGKSVASMWKRDPAEGERRIDRVVSLAHTALEEMRALLAELRPADPNTAVDLPSHPAASRLRRGGLAAALKAHLEATIGDEGPRVELDTAAYRPVEPEREEALLRIAQEATANALKHGRPKTLRLRLTADEAGAVTLTVADDGVGFDPGAARPAAQTAGSGLGLTSMRERAEELGGTLTVAARPGGGTAVTAVLPARSGESES
jgi:Signal transduction histidine kinase